MILVLGPSTPMVQVQRPKSKNIKGRRAKFADGAGSKGQGRRRFSVYGASSPKFQGQGPRSPKVQGRRAKVAEVTGSWAEVAEVSGSKGHGRRMFRMDGPM